MPSPFGSISEFALAVHSAPGGEPLEYWRGYLAAQCERNETPDADERGRVRAFRHAAMEAWENGTVELVQRRLPADSLGRACWAYLAIKRRKPAGKRRLQWEGGEK